MNDIINSKMLSINSKMLSINSKDIINSKMLSINSKMLSINSKMLSINSKMLSINSKTVTSAAGNCSLMSSDDFITEVEKSFKKIIDYGRTKCCVCHHDLDDHIDEGNFWRCHALGLDHYQCECILSKHKAKNDINFYDLALRAKEQIEELRQSNDIIEKL